MEINYQKVGWDTTKYFNPTNMNQMDNGIKAACDKADANEAAIADVNSKLGNTDISAIGDGTVTGGLDALNSNLNNIKVTKVQISCLSSPMYFYKIGRLVQLVYTGDTVASVATGDLGTVGTLPDDLKPYKITQFVNFPLNTTKIQLVFNENGIITAYNYTENAITQITTCRYGGCYIS